MYLLTEMMYDGNAEGYKRMHRFRDSGLLTHLSLTPILPKERGYHRNGQLKRTDYCEVMLRHWA